MNPVLLVRPGGLGDLMVALPSLRLLRRLYRDSPLHLAARREFALLLRDAAVVDEVHSLDDRTFSPLFTDDPSLDAAPRLHGETPAALWSWFFRPPSGPFPKSAAALVPGAAHVIVYDSSAGRPVSRDWFERTAAAAGRPVSDEDFEACARLPRSGSPRPKPSDRPYAIVHPGSGGRNKRWPAERFLAIVDVLAGRGVAGLLVTGPAEEDGEWESRRLPPGWHRYPSPPLDELADRLSTCGLYVGNDSGVTHLAAAAGAPTLALYLGENLPAWRPFGRATVLHAPHTASISFEEVRAAALGLLPG
jgi:ADP-heptose:LPS heptosyltransferase